MKEYRDCIEKHQQKIQTTQHAEHMSKQKYEMEFARHQEELNEVREKWRREHKEMEERVLNDYQVRVFSVNCCHYLASIYKKLIAKWWQRIFHHHHL